MHTMLRTGLRVWRGPLAAAAATGTVAMLQPHQEARCAAVVVESEVAEEHPVFAVDKVWLDAYVDKILAERELNVELVPDPVEKRIYKMVIRLFLDAIYKMLNEADGAEIWGHELDVSLEKLMGANLEEVLGATISSDIDGRPIKRLVQVLMEESTIDQDWLPDEVEEQLYFNCLMLLFRLVERVASTMRVDVCGHQLSMKFEPVRNHDLFDDMSMEMLKQLSISASGKSSVSEAQVHATIRRCMHQAGADDTYIPSSPIDVISRRYEVDLYAKLYTVMLGLMKSVLDKSELRVLDERVTAAIVPKRGKAYQQLVKKKQQPSSVLSMSPTEKAGGTALFLGMAFGAVLVVFAQGHT